MANLNLYIQGREKYLEFKVEQVPGGSWEVTYVEDGKKQTSPPLNTLDGAAAYVTEQIATQQIIWKALGLPPPVSSGP